MVPWAYMAGGFQSASTPENPDSLRPVSSAWRAVAASGPRAAHGPPRVPLDAGRFTSLAPDHSAGADHPARRHGGGRDERPRDDLAEPFRN
jgi:hypothetical protein